MIRDSCYCCRCCCFCCCRLLVNSQNTKKETVLQYIFCFNFFSLVIFNYSNEQDTQENIWAGMLCVIFFFLIISVLAFPNGPFTRPHPAVWRIIFGISVIYLLFIIFLMFQNYKVIMEIFYWFDPSLRNFNIDMDKVWMTK